MSISKRFDKCSFEAIDADGITMAFTVDHEILVMLLDDSIWAVVGGLEGSSHAVDADEYK